MDSISISLAPAIIDNRSFLLKTLFFGIECKAKGNKPTALQQKNLDEITKAGGIALVIDEHNVDQVIELITEGYWDK